MASADGQVLPSARGNLSRKRHEPAIVPFAHIVILCNPASTHAAQGKRRIAELEDICGSSRITIIETAPGGPEANRQLLRAHADILGPNTLLCVAAGDGTLSLIIETLVIDPALPDGARRTPVLPLWGGNANDLAHMLNGTALRANLRTILTRGEVIAIHPLSCVLRPPRGKPQTRIAACYASFGATAFAAAKLNEPQHRNHPLHRIPGGRFLKELLTGFSALMEAPTFKVKEHGDLKIVYERTFTNGSRFAKVGRLPLNLTDDVFYLHTLNTKHPLAILSRVFSFLQKRVTSKFVHDHAEFTVQEPTLAQFDGEPTEISPHTKVTVHLSEQPFYALTTLLADTHK